MGQKSKHSFTLITVPQVLDQYLKDQKVRFREVFREFDNDK